MTPFKIGDRVRYRWAGRLAGLRLKEARRLAGLAGTVLAVHDVEPIFGTSGMQLLVEEALVRWDGPHQPKEQHVKTRALERFK